VTIHEDVIYNVKLTGTSQVIAESKRTAAAVDDMKRRAASSSTTVGAVGARGVAGGAAGSFASTEARFAAANAEAAALSGRLTARRQQLDRELAAEQAAARSGGRRAFGERGRAIATAAGAGRFAGLAAPFGGWGPLIGIGAGFAAINQYKPRSRTSA
jgi:hypothetical protein